MNMRNFRSARLFWMGDRKLSPRVGRTGNRCRQTGAATVELTFALFILLALTIVYWEFVAIFFVQQRVNYATYMGERSCDLGGFAAQ